ncbi:MAG TPA: triphosphoribosyl-dephospho-CoA synthase [Oxalicibacterium sp.]|uniref:triphosphoribosyl-dephospho-CoA synthase n=1 Tax=Oxalicibacterium sp. TaxID=2766525 RepID=UPI002CC4A03E|nr:triphosphoribosyl-dephospho-CoA synthase [Oxalicibacterium sp.]HWU97810.1 triphosphoribosyl-dephospho-CoA synthase [Oxalicibacterium sp.]
MRADHPLSINTHSSHAVERAMRLANLAVMALIDEATLTPKPGLVDLRGRGAHRDLDWMMMCDSADMLHPTFYAMAVAGMRHDNSHDNLHDDQHRNDQILREELGEIGRVGEAVMLRATGGVNTHRGAIWTLGLLVGAAAQHIDTAHIDTAAGIASRAGAIARQTDRHAPTITGNKGEQACLTYGVGGARGQAMAGFPHVVHHALPSLHAARLRGLGEDHARLNALLAVMAELDDTCILSRGGVPALHIMQAGARAVLQADDDRLAREAALRQLVQQALALNVSPGGAADLLAATLFLDSLTMEYKNETPALSATATH